MLIRSLRRKSGGLRESVGQRRAAAQRQDEAIPFQGSGLAEIVCGLIDAPKMRSAVADMISILAVVGATRRRY